MSAIFSLSERLRAVASYVEPGTRVVDVGTDHAYVPIWLLLNGICDTACGSDNKAGPLGRAETDARYWGVAGRLTLRLCDGLSGWDPASVDTVILAGMGGETIRDILDAAPWALKKRLILQPQTHPEQLEHWLGERDAGVADVTLAADAGRIYDIWLALPGEAPVRAAVHPSLIEKRDPLLRPWLEDRLRKGRRKLLGMERAREPDTTAMAELRRELDALREVLERFAACSG